jgi:hypothetical protein
MNDRGGIDIALAGLLVVIVVGATDSSAQTVDEQARARAGFAVSYGGHGPDFEASVDTSRWKRVRVRGAVGFGRWVNQADASSQRSPGAPPLMRLAATLIWFGDPAGVSCPAPCTRASSRHTRAYGGVGVAIFLPRVETIRAATGVHVVFGFLEGSGKRWSVAVPEITIDWPVKNVTPQTARARYELAPADRIGLAVRRRF